MLGKKLQAYFSPMLGKDGDASHGKEVTNSPQKKTSKTKIGSEIQGLEDDKSSLGYLQRPCLFQKRYVFFLYRSFCDLEKLLKRGA